MNNEILVWGQPNWNYRLDWYIFEDPFAYNISYDITDKIACLNHAEWKLPHVAKGCYLSTNMPSHQYGNPSCKDNPSLQPSYVDNGKIYTIKMK